jgi:hypothetical protein
MRRGFAAVTALAAVTLVGCGGDGTGLVVEGTAPTTPYSGPLHVPVADLDEDNARAARVASGAAGRALECDGEIYSGGGGEAWSEGDGGNTPEEGLAAYFDMEQPDLPRSGYRAERVEADRVLYSLDVDGRTKVAVVVAKDRRDAPGWGPEAAASCDPAELPASFTDAQGWEIWTDAEGNRVPVTEVSSHEGDAHCGWEKAHFLATGQGKKARLYVRDPQGVLDSTVLTTPYDGDVRLPADARDTGYRYGDRQLWLTDSTGTAYVRTRDGVEKWPAAKDEALGCK